MILAAAAQEAARESPYTAAPKTGVDWKFLYFYVTTYEWIIIIVLLLLILAVAAHDPILKYDDYSAGRFTLFLYLLVGAMIGLVINLLKGMA